MSREDQTSRIAVLLFTDMVDSVAIERRVGTEAYSRLLMRHHQLFREAQSAVGDGKIHLDTGDGFFAEFTTAAAAVNAALLFQMFIRENRWETEAPKVRIGLHLGQFAEIKVDPASPGKIVGIPVSMASRVMGLAQGGQILMTRQVYDDARQFVREHPRSNSGRQAPGLAWKSHGAYVFKGSDQPSEVFEVGAAGYAPLTAPPMTEKAQRVDTLERRPARGVRRPVAGAIVVALAGLALWSLPIGEPWVNASYDYLFRFSTRVPTNKLALVLMDNAACDALHQTRTNWDRALHVELLNRLTAAGSSAVVFDINFFRERDKASDTALAAAIRRHGKVALMDKPDQPLRFPRLEVSQTIKLPNKLFLDAGAVHGIGEAAANPLEIVRSHWPFPVRPDDQVHSLPWAAAELAGANLQDVAGGQWLRYYGAAGSWETFSYHLALSNDVSQFKGWVVFVGNDPEFSNVTQPEPDKFLTPYSRWNSEPVGGVKILATTFLNLVNRDWLRRLPWPAEAALLILAGTLIGGGLSCLGRSRAVVGAAVLFVAITLGGVALSHYSNLWFPWLIVAGAQVPCALAWVCLAPARRAGEASAFVAEAQPQPAPAQSASANVDELVAKAVATVESPAPKPTKEILAPAKPFLGMPEVADYELFNPPFGEGAFGKVWLVRNAIGQWQALKTVYEAKFGGRAKPYETEFKGIQRYKPVSDKHPALLRVDFVSTRKPKGYFYYVMELGDAMGPGWEKNPRTYRPRDLATVRAMAPGRKLPLAECVRIGLALADGLEYLHEHGLTHRDIKPQNIIFVNNHPKLADVGLVTDIRPEDEERTNVGTPGYMPPLPEMPGTPQGDVYGLGMVLFVISTGRDPQYFQEVSTTLIEGIAGAEYAELNQVILKACHADRASRYASAGEMSAELGKIGKS